MSEPIPYRRVAIAPLACLSESWNLVRGQYWVFFGIAAVGILLGSVAPLGILMGPMMCGIYLCFMDASRGMPVRFELLFKGFDHFTQSLIATLLMMAAGLLVTIPMAVLVVVLVIALGLSGAGRHGPGSLALLLLFAYGGAFFFLMLVSVVIGTLFAFTFPLIVDKRLSGVDAVQTSLRAAFANIGGMLGLGLLSFGLGLAGMCLCYVGAFFVMPATFGAHWMAYRRVFGTADPDPMRPRL